MSLITRLFLSALIPELRHLRSAVSELQRKVATLMADQNELVATFTAALAGLSADVAALKAAVKPNEIMSQENFDKLSALADKFAALDAETPVAPTEPAA